MATYNVTKGEFAVSVDSSANNGNGVVSILNTKTNHYITFTEHEFETMQDAVSACLNLWFATEENLTVVPTKTQGNN